MDGTVSANRLSPTVSELMTAFSANEFYQRNRRLVIWVILFALLWLLRDFFALVFMTFVLATFAMPITAFGRRRMKLPHWAALALIYLAFVVLLASFARFVAPSVASELNRMIDNLPETNIQLLDVKNRLIERYPTLRQPLGGFLASALDEDTVQEVALQLADERARLSITQLEIARSVESNVPPNDALAEYFARRDQLYLNALAERLFQQVREYAPAVINMLYSGTATILLALLFSFLILNDRGNLRRGIGRLKNSRVGDFYEEAAEPIVRFGVLLGRAIKAQATIAVVNTVLTLVGLLVLGIPLVAMLSVIVFVCSFIPVLGVFISTTPIVLVALNAGGPTLSLLAVAMIVIIHVVEAYLLNPIIYSRHLKLNPVFTLIIVYVGYHTFGLWGMLLGVPVTRYFIHDVLGVPFRDQESASELEAPSVPAFERPSHSREVA
ncbi:MAG TPA: AI-2E family transporter [Woeseiaceae bacterium]